MRRGREGGKKGGRRREGGREGEEGRQLKIICFIRLAEKIKVQLMRVADSSKQQQQQEPIKTTVTAGLLETFSSLLLWSGTKLFQCKK